MENLNQFSISVYQSLINNFPDLDAYFTSVDKCLIAEFNSPKNVLLGGMVVQTTSENDIWLRIHPPCSGYLVDDLDELTEIIKGVLNDNILWAIGYRGVNWKESTLVREKDDLKLEYGIQYILYSWSGEKDETIQM